MRAFRAEPTKVASFAPGRSRAVLSRPGRASRLAEPREVFGTNCVDRAPVERLGTRFLETMRAKGWLRDR